MAPSKNTSKAELIEEIGKLAPALSDDESVLQDLDEATLQFLLELLEQNPVARDSSSLLLDLILKSKAHSSVKFPSSGSSTRSHTPFGSGAPSGGASSPIGSGGPATRGTCFIATAAYGSALDKDVEVLRRFRDAHLLKSPVGKAFVSIYARYSPRLASHIRRRAIARTLVRAMLRPIVMLIRLADD